MDGLRTALERSRSASTGVQRDVDALRNIGDDAARKKERAVQLMLQQLQSTDSAASRVEGLVSRLREHSTSTPRSARRADSTEYGRSQDSTRVRSLEYELQVQRDSHRMLLRDLQEQSTVSTEKLAEQVLTLSSQLAEMTVRNKELAEAANAHRARCAAAERALASQREAEEALARELGERHGAAEELATMRSLYAAERAEWEGRAEKQAYEIRTLRRRVDDTEHALAMHEQQRELEQRAAVAQVHGAEAAARSALVYEETAERSAVDAIAKHMEVEVVRDMYKESACRVLELDEALVAEQTAHAESKLQVADLQADAVLLRREVQRGEREAAAHVELRQVAADLEDTVRCSHTAAKECEAQLNDAVAEKEASQAQLHAQGVEIESLRGRANDLSAALDAARLEKTVLSKRIAEETRMREDAERKVDSKAQLASQLQGLVDTLQAALKAAEERVKHETYERRAAESERLRVADTLRDAEATLRAAQQAQVACESRLAEEVASREAAENEALAATKRLSAASREYESQASRLRTQAAGLSPGSHDSHGSPLTTPVLSRDTLQHLPAQQPNPLLVPTQASGFLVGGIVQRGSMYSSYSESQHARRSFTGDPDPQPDLTESVEVSNDSSSTISPSSSSTSSLNTSREDFDITGVGATVSVMSGLDFCSPLTPGRGNGVGHASPPNHRGAAKGARHHPSEPFPPTVPYRERAPTGKTSPAMSRNSDYSEGPAASEQRYPDSGEGPPPNSSSTSSQANGDPAPAAAASPAGVGGPSQSPPSLPSPRRTLQQITEKYAAAAAVPPPPPEEPPLPPAPQHEYSSIDDDSISIEVDAAAARGRHLRAPNGAGGEGGDHDIGVISPITQDDDDLLEGGGHVSPITGGAKLLPESSIGCNTSSSNSHRSPRKPSDSPVSKPPFSPASSSASLHATASGGLVPEPGVVPGIYAHVKVQRDAQGQVGISHQGVDIVEVTPGSAAEAAGIRPGHRLLLINGRRVETPNDVNNAFEIAPDEYEITLQLPIDLQVSG